jgi:hypothetical protein
MKALRAAPSRANAAKTHCAHGHPFEGENLIIRSDGGRGCRVCARERNRRYCERHPEVRKESRQRYEELNRDLCRERKRRWEEENREAKRERNRRYYAQEKARQQAESAVLLSKACQLSLPLDDTAAA